MRLFGKRKVEIIKSEVLEPEKIKLLTLLDLVQNGHLIGLKITDRDSSDAMYRILEFDNFRVHFSEWSEWTIRIEVFSDNDTFQVYKSTGLKIDWHEGTVELANPGKCSLEIEWDHEGVWCTYITNKVKEEKYKLDLKRENDKRNEEIKKKQEEEETIRLIEGKKKSFNNLFKNKL
ncbi:hypothetical protein ACOQFO_10465 [Ureibacillus sp. MALMAid1270]|uniref:hypothetical protein n=1 Tax=Ureibacillus sp. MALMAid1270 TaxID=3411629 RepID=UPI003BA79C08